MVNSSFRDSFIPSIIHDGVGHDYTAELILKGAIQQQQVRAPLRTPVASWRIPTYFQAVASAPSQLR